MRYFYFYLIGEDMSWVNGMVEVLLLVRYLKVFMGLFGFDFLI